MSSGDAIRSVTKMLDIVDLGGSVSQITLTRDEKRNALSVELCGAIVAALRECVDGGARAVVLTSTGSVFSAGADLDETDFHGELYPAIEKLVLAVRALPIPVVAFVNGPAIGAGAMLAMACDLRIVSQEAGFRIPVSDMAIGVDAETVQALESLVGGSRARAMLLAGTTLPASEAVDCGFALRQGSLEDAVAQAGALAKKAPLTIAQLKMEFDPEGFSFAERNEAREAAWNSDDNAEVQRARAEKRAPRFSGN